MSERINRLVTSARRERWSGVGCPEITCLRHPVPKGQRCQGLARILAGEGNQRCRRKAKHTIGAWWFGTTRVVLTYLCSECRGLADLPIRASAARRRAAV